MKKYLTAILIVCTTTVVVAQNNYQDVVYLKNGSIIYGVIIEQIPDKSIKIETTDGSVFVFQMGEIEKLTKESTKGNNPGLESGYRGIIEVGYELGLTESDRLKLNIINGYQINPYFSLGFGLGLRYTYYISDREAIIPIFGDLRVNFMDKGVSPYSSLAVGYSLNGDNDFKKEGILFNIIGGVSFMVSDESAMNIGVGYEMQRLPSDRNIGVLSITAGISY